MQKSGKTMEQLFKAEKPSNFLMGYYNNIAELIKLGVVDLAVKKDAAPSEVTGKDIDAYYNNPNSSDNKNAGMKKLSGAIAAEYFRKEIASILNSHFKNQYKISENNVYIKGCHVEFDFLILKGEAKNIAEVPVYNSDDVVAILECKANGIYTKYNEDNRFQFDKADFKFDLERFVNAYFDIIKGYNKGIKIGYMTMDEYRPKSDNGKSDLIESTLLYMKDKFEYKLKENNVTTEKKLWDCFFARCHYTTKNQEDRYMSDEQWEQFVLNLVS